MERKYFSDLRNLKNPRPVIVSAMMCLALMLDTNCEKNTKLDKKMSLLSREQRWWRLSQMAMKNEKQCVKKLYDLIISDQKDQELYNALKNHLRIIGVQRFDVDQIHKLSLAAAVVVKVVNWYLDKWSVSAIGLQSPSTLCRVYEHRGSPLVNKNGRLEILTDLPRQEQEEVVESPTTLCKVYSHPESPLRHAEEHMKTYNTQPLIIPEPEHILITKTPQGEKNENSRYRRQ